MLKLDNLSDNYCRGFRYHCWVYRLRRYKADYIEYMQCVNCCRVYPVPEYD
jgi:hypothetical protein